MNTPALISTLSHCIDSCESCASACISEENCSQLQACILTDLDCSAYCSLLLKAISRKSPLIETLTETCIKVCEACEEECNKHDHDHCQECAEACRKCIEACKNHLQTLQN